MNSELTVSESEELALVVPRAGLSSTSDQPAREDASDDKKLQSSASSEEEPVSIPKNPGTDVFKSVHDLVDQLLELVPALRQFHSHLQLTNRAHATKAQEFCVSQAALPFVRSVADRFKNAGQRLAERLGEANWQRF